MKAIATKEINRDLAVEIATETIEAICRAVKDSPVEDCTCYEHSNVCSCPARHWGGGVVPADNPDGVPAQVSCAPDWTGAEFGLMWPEKNVIEFFSNTCGGTTHSLSINLDTGLLTATHEGARRSDGGLLFRYLSPKFWGLNDAEDWTLVEVQSSQPEWGVYIALLHGQSKPGPITLEEAENEAALRRGEVLKKKLRAIRYENIPETIWGYPDGSFEADMGRFVEPFNPHFEGAHYRRAAVQGVRL